MNIEPLGITLGEALPKEMARVREILGLYRAIGPAGSFGAAMMELDLRAADQAVINRNLVGMIIAYKALQTYKE